MSWDLGSKLNMPCRMFDAFPNFVNSVEQKGLTGGFFLANPPKLRSVRPSSLPSDKWEVCLQA